MTSSFTRPASPALLLALLLLGSACRGAPAVQVQNEPVVHARTEASQAVEYEVAFPNPGTHEVQVVATFRGLTPGSPLEIRMSRSSPGRYAEHAFAKNVYAVRATDGRGRELALARPDEHAWSAAGHDGTVRMSYVVWGDRVDGTYLGVDATHAHMNMPATFVWARGLERSPVRLTVRPREGWRVITQLARTADPATFTAPNLQYFLDSPTEVGPSDVRSWRASYGGRSATYNLAVHHLGTAGQVDSLAAMTRAVVDEQHGIWGTMPGYDFGEYTFIVDQLPWASGDGMEHRNSTIVSGREPITTHAQRLARLGTISHELFHAWNVERLRPRSLEPFDFTRANMSGELWLAEGFTSYYGPLAIRRAGLYTDDEFARMVGGAIINVIQSPARAYGSPVDMSRRAPFVDAATSIDPTHHHNTFLSYYTWGAAVAAGLDLTLRARFDLTLDDWMRALWRDFGSHQSPALSPGRPYTLAELRTSLGTLTRDTAFANDYFRRYIEGSEVPDYAALLARAGFLLASDSATAWLGASFGDDSTGVFVNWTAANGPLFPLGINNGDVITSVDGQQFTKGDSLVAYAARKGVGGVVRLEIAGRGGVRTTSVTLPGRQRLRLTSFESAGRAVTPEMRAFRARWLASRAEK